MDDRTPSRARRAGRKRGRWRSSLDRGTRAGRGFLGSPGESATRTSAGRTCERWSTSGRRRRNRESFAFTSARIARHERASGASSLRFRCRRGDVAARSGRRLGGRARRDPPREAALRAAWKLAFSERNRRRGSPSRASLRTARRCPREQRCAERCQFPCRGRGGIGRGASFATRRSPSLRERSAPCARDTPDRGLRTFG